MNDSILLSNFNENRPYSDRTFSLSMFLQAQSKKSVVALSEVSQIQSKSSPLVEKKSGFKWLSRSSQPRIF